MTDININTTDIKIPVIQSGENGFTRPHNLLDKVLVAGENISITEDETEGKITIESAGAAQSANEYTDHEVAAISASLDDKMNTSDFTSENVVAKVIEGRGTSGLLASTTEAGFMSTNDKEMLESLVNPQTEFV